MSAREEILQRVRSALRDVDADAAAAARVAPPAGARPPGEVIEHFVERVVDYRAVVERGSAADLPRLLRAALAEARSFVVPADLEQVDGPWSEWGGVVEDPAHLLSATDLDGIDAVVTGCCLGIAETGTIVLDHGPGQGRRALSLVPDLHVCIVRADQVVADVPEAIAQLASSVQQGRALTWISGPSATSDIELDRVEGVHGPRRLHVLVIR